MLFVNVLLLATRRIISNGAMTCPVRRHMRQLVKRLRSWDSTNLSLIEDRQEGICNGAIGAPRSNDQQRAHSIEDTRLDEHSDNCRAQSADLIHPQGGTSVSGL